MGRRVGDYRAYEPGHSSRQRKGDAEHWGGECEFYRADIRSLHLGLVEDKLERAVRNIHTDFLQLDQKPRKAVLALPSLLPTPLLEIILKVLFNHFTQPPAVTILTTPMLACIGAGQRNALVVDVGWEETVITAIGEYKEVYQRRSVRAGKMLTQEMARLLVEEAKKSGEANELVVGFETADNLTERVAWCRPSAPTEIDTALNDAFDITISGSSSLSVPFKRLSDPAETVFFTPTPADQDHNDLSLPTLAHRVLLALGLDLRASVISRIVITGGVSQLPGLKQRLLQEISQLASTRGWDPVHSYGSASAHRERILQERNANAATRIEPAENDVPLSPMKKPIQDTIPHSERIHDDIKDPASMKAEGRAADGKTLKTKTKVVTSVVRGVETVGAWSGASLAASLRVKGVHEVEREEFLKHGLKDGAVGVI